MKHNFFLLCAVLLCIASHVKSQDLRASQYNAIPLLLNPAQTGDASAPMRLTFLHGIIGNDSIQNRITNISLDAPFSRKSEWFYGINYMVSGDRSFAVKGNYLAASVARRYFLDSEKKHQLRIGVQLNRLQARNDDSKQAYDRLLDVSVMKH